MENKEIQNKKVEVITDVICDCCGESCKKNEDVVTNPSNANVGETLYCFEFMTLKANWSYFSNHDMENWTAHLCEKCVEEKLSFIKFKKDAR